MGALPPTFKNAANPLAHEQMQAQYNPEREAKVMAERDKQFVRDEGMREAPSTSVILGADGQMRQMAEMQKADAKRQSDNTETQLLLSILNQRLAEIDQAITKIDERIGEIDERLGEIEIEMDELDRLEEIAASGEMPTDPDDIALLEGYGITEEDLQNQDANIIIAQARKDREAEQGELTSERGDLVKDRGELDNERDRIEDMTREFETGAINAEEMQAQMSEMDMTFEGRDELATVLVKTADSSIAESVIQSVDSTAKGQEELRSASLGDGFFSSSADVFDFDDPISGATSAARDLDGFEISAPNVKADFTRSASPEPAVPSPSIDLDITNDPALQDQGFKL